MNKRITWDDVEELHRETPIAINTLYKMAGLNDGVMRDAKAKGTRIDTSKNPDRSARVAKVLMDLKTRLDRILT